MPARRTQVRLQRAATVAAVISLFAFLSPPAQAAPSYSLTDLGTLGGPMSAATAINDRGQVIGQSLVSGDFVTHSFLWTPGAGMVDLGTLGGAGTQALALSDAGEVVGWSDTPEGPRHAFSWTPSGGMRDLGTLGGSRSRAAAVNEHGQVVGWSDGPDGRQHAFSWTAAGGMVDLGPGFAADVNAAGQVVGLRDGTAFLWSEAGGFVPLGTLGGTFSTAIAINDGGEVTGVSQTASGSSRGFYWSAGTGMVAIDTLGGSFSVPVAINASGRIAGWGPAADGSSHGFLWDKATGLADLGTPGGNFTPQAMNDSGEIVGSTFVAFPSFETQITVWTPQDGFFSLGPFGGPPTTVAVNGSGEIAANSAIDGEQHAVVWSPGSPPTITSADSAVFTVGAPGSFTVTTEGDPTAAVSVAGDLPGGLSFTDNGDGTATIAGTPASATGGIYPFTITATNGTEPDAVQPFELRIEYVFGGFLAPIDPAAINVATAGAAIPVKFSLGGDQSLAILAAGSPSSNEVSCATGLPTSPVDGAVSPGESGLTFDATENIYTYVWKTERAWSGTCRALTLLLRDGRAYQAAFRFRS